MQDQLLKTDAQKAECFNEFFSSVFTQDDGNLPHFARRVPAELRSVTFSEHDIYETIRSFLPKMSSGPDNISTYLLKRLSSSVCKPLSLIFNSSMYRSEVPDIWKHALISPIYKSKGTKKKAKNYRPISLTCVPCRVFESIVNRRLLDFLLKNDAISRFQHGFLSKRSTATQLLTCVSSWFSAMNRNKCIDIIYLDLAKAFDSVSHQKLLQKLAGYRHRRVTKIGRSRSPKSADPDPQN